MVKYLHCGNCWSVLGKIPSSDPEWIFDTFDCGWGCNCGRYNLSSDGLYSQRNSKGNKHFVYIREYKDEARREIFLA
ncbi:hypothetical protein ACFL0X_01100 [Nanoarchaeota archaeon]